MRWGFSMAKEKKCAACDHFNPKKAIRCVQCKEPFPSQNENVKAPRSAAMERMLDTPPGLKLVAVLVVGLIFGVSVVAPVEKSAVRTSSGSALKKRDEAIQPRYDDIDLDTDSITSYGIMFGRAIVCGVDVDAQLKIIGRWIDQAENPMYLAIFTVALDSGAKGQADGNSPDSCTKVREEIRLVTLPKI